MSEKGNSLTSRTKSSEQNDFTDRICLNLGSNLLNLALTMIYGISCWLTSGVGITPVAIMLLGMLVAI